MEQEHFVAGAILDAMRDGVLTLDMTGRIAFCNPAAGEFFGMSPESLVGKPFHEIALAAPPDLSENSGEADEFSMPQDDLMQVVLDTIYEQKTIRNRVLDLRVNGGETRSLSVSATHLRDNEGQLTGAVLVLADITEMQRLHEAERRLNQELKDAVRQIDSNNQELKESVKRGRRTRIMIACAALLLFIGVGGYLWQGDLLDMMSDSSDRRDTPPGTFDGGEENAASLPSIVVEPRPLSRSISLSGTVAPREEVTLSAPFPAAIKKKNFFYGQRVKRGDILLTLDTTEIQSQMRDARSAFIKAGKRLKELQSWTSGPEMSKARRDLSQCQSRLQRAKQTMEDNKILLDKGIIPATEYENSQHSYEDTKMQLLSAQESLESIMRQGDDETREIARMELANAKAKYEQLQHKLSLAVVRAPVSGIAIRPTTQNNEKVKDLETGASVQEGQALLSVGSLEGLSIMAKVDELDINNLQVGQKVAVTGDAFPGISLEGKIVHLSSQALVEGQVPVFEAVIRLDELPDELKDIVRLGMTAHMRVIIYSNPKALTVPLGAVQMVQGESMVRVLTPNGSIRPVKVVTGYTTLNSVEIVSGLEAGARVLFTPQAGAFVSSGPDSGSQSRGVGRR